MPRLNSVILDANVVIYLHEIGLWETLLTRCEVHLADTVANHEVRFFHGAESDELIDLSQDIAHQRVTVFQVPLAIIEQFTSRFDPSYRDALDPGETESLALLMQGEARYQICSGDAIVFRVLGLLNRSQQGISLEELLRQLGLQKSVLRQYTKKFREHYTQQGQYDAVLGRGLKR